MPEASQIGPFVYVSMTPTAVNDTTGFLPPADQPGPGPQLQTNDDRFLNAVLRTARSGPQTEPAVSRPGTPCKETVSTTWRSRQAELASRPDAHQSDQQRRHQQDDLFYPAVSLDCAGDLITVFDESSTSHAPSIVDASIASVRSTLSSFQTLHTSSTYYNGNDLFTGACDSEGCRWGDYSGAAQDPSNPKDVWVVSGSADESTSWCAQRSMRAGTRRSTTSRSPVRPSRR